MFLVILAVGSEGFELCVWKYVEGVVSYFCWLRVTISWLWVDFMLALVIGGGLLCAFCCFSACMLRRCSTLGFLAISGKSFTHSVTLFLINEFELFVLVASAVTVGCL